MGDMYNQRSNMRDMYKERSNMRDMYNQRSNMRDMYNVHPTLWYKFPFCSLKTGRDIQWFSLNMTLSVIGLQRLAAHWRPPWLRTHQNHTPTEPGRSSLRSDISL